MTGENLYQRDVRQQIKKPTQQGSRVRFFLTPRELANGILCFTMSCNTRESAFWPEMLNGTHSKLNRSK